MKIVSSVVSLYQEQVAICSKLRTEVDALIKKEQKNSWHYVSRIKALESFALKLETGRCDNPAQVEDFFACMLVVENHNQIRVAYEIVDRLFHIHTRRPKEDGLTHKSPESFPFDDLRLYCTLRSDERMPNTKLNTLTFELQIKTFLQHAWSIATHDLIYKSDEISWPRERVAFQTKAILEQVEMSISGIESLVLLPEIAKTNHEIKELMYIKREICSRWTIEELPNDVIRLVKNVLSLSKEYHMTTPEIFSYLDKETSLGKGISTKNLSPFNIIVQSIINQNSDKLGNKLTQEVKGNSKPSFRLFTPSELDISRLTNIEHKRIVVIH